MDPQTVTFLTQVGFTALPVAGGFALGYLVVFLVLSQQYASEKAVRNLADESANRAGKLKRTREELTERYRDFSTERSHLDFLADDIKKKMQQTYIEDREGLDDELQALADDTEKLVAAGNMLAGVAATAAAELDRAMAGGLAGTAAPEGAPAIQQLGRHPDARQAVTRIARWKPDEADDKEGFVDLIRAVKTVADGMYGPREQPGQRSHEDTNSMGDNT
ncbi:MAG: hypothetical protein R6V19_12445 [Armatimonadota bacterium]